MAPTRFSWFVYITAADARGVRYNSRRSDILFRLLHDDATKQVDVGHHTFIFVWLSNTIAGSRLRQVRGVCDTIGREAGIHTRYNTHQRHVEQSIMLRAPTYDLSY